MCTNLRLSHVPGHCWELSLRIWANELSPGSIAYTIMAYIVMAYIVMAYIVMTDIVMAYIVMTYIVMAYIAMAYTVGDAVSCRCRGAIYVWPI